MNMQLTEAFETLKEFCGNHTKAARLLGLSRDHYRRVRNGRAVITQQLQYYILGKAKDLIINRQPKDDTNGASEADH